MTPAGGNFYEREFEFRSLDSGVLVARAYIPEGARPFPGIVEVHGGGWTSGHRLSDSSLNRALASRGIAVIAIDFRMPPEFRFPVSVADVNFAISWAKRHAHEFGSCSDLIGGLGTSSGGHQILLNALVPDDPLYAGDLPTSSDASLRCIVACWPVADPVARYAMAKRARIEFLIEAHDAFWASEAEMALGNPQRLLDEQAFTHLPPLLIIQGSGDENLPSDMAANFAASYRIAGGSVRLETFDGEPHAFITRAPDSPAARAAIDVIAAFIHDQCSSAQ